MKRISFIIVTVLLCLPAIAQWQWHSPMRVGFSVLQNRAFNEESDTTYARLPGRVEPIVGDAVWSLSRASSGLAIYFNTDASSLRVRYKVNGGYSMAHMPATGVSGVDLYRVDPDGGMRFCFGKYSFGDTITYTYDHLDSGMSEYRLYLPLYNSVKFLEIGVPAGSDFCFVPASKEAPVVVYGTSIAQGACASRPAMAWVSILQRSLGIPVVNLGFSGRGLLEPGLMQVLSEIDARMYIIDCMANLGEQDEDEIIRRIVEGVGKIRLTRESPILLVEHAGYANMFTNPVQRDIVMKVNNASRKAYERLKTDGVPEVYYMTRDELDLDPDGWVDYVHPSDLGQKQQAVRVERKVREILRMD